MNNSLNKNILQTGCVLYRWTNRQKRQSRNEREANEQTGRSGVLRSSVENHTGLSSGGIEDPVVRARLGAQVRLVVLQRRLVGRQRSRLRFWSGRDDGWRLFLSWSRRRGGDLLLHCRLAHFGFRCFKKTEKRGSHKWVSSEASRQMKTVPCPTQKEYQARSVTAEIQRKYNEPKSLTDDQLPTPPLHITPVSFPTYWDVPF